MVAAKRLADVTPEMNLSENTMPCIASLGVNKAVNYGFETKWKRDQNSKTNVPNGSKNMCIHYKKNLKRKEKGFTIKP